MRSSPDQKRALAMRVIVLFALAASLADAQTPTALWNFAGTAGERLGNSVDGGHDVDGDGRPDVIVGSSNSSVGGPTFGTARVLSGSTGAVIWILHGPATGSGFGTRVAMLGDLDLDGRADFAVSAPGDATGGAGAGSVRAYSGMTGSLLFTVLGSPGLGYGSQLAAVGDVDLDGVPDFVVAASTSTAVPGRVELVSGATQALIVPAFVGTAGQRLGTQLAGRGDANGDGVRDFLVAAAIGTSGGPSVYVRSGSDGSLLTTHALGSLDTLHSIAFVGDVNQDGRDDYAISTAAGSALSQIRSGANGSLLASWTPIGAEIFATAGDVNGDCIQDLVTLELTGLLNATVNLIARSGTSGAVLAQLTGVTLNAAVSPTKGYSIAGVGDADGDGHPDVVVASREDSPFVGTNVGFARLYDLGFTGAPPRVTRSGIACLGSAGNRIRAYLTGCPRLSQSVGFAARNALASTPVVMNLGMPAAIPLTALGMTGCTAYATTDGFNIFTSSDGAGVANIGPFIVPNVPAIIGLAMAFQTVAVDSLANPAGLVASDRIEFRFGD
ncbi:MAG: VCBS repeat-containing protein [Planctomycetes bacterium]|nr:VCBS repeat-containing protein [Planctomycetota bacterium]